MAADPRRLRPGSGGGGIFRKGNWKMIPMLFFTLKNLHHDIAADVWPNGAILTCKVCKFIQEANSQDCGHYLAHGWPVHCGQTMQLETWKEETE